MPNNRVMAEALTLLLQALEAIPLGQHGHGHPDHLQSREKVPFGCSFVLNRIRLTLSGVTSSEPPPGTLGKGSCRLLHSGCAVSYTDPQPGEERRRHSSPGPGPGSPAARRWVKPDAVLASSDIGWNNPIQHWLRGFAPFLQRGKTPALSVSREPSRSQVFSE